VKVIWRAGLLVAGLVMALVISFPVAAASADTACYQPDSCATTTVPGQVPKPPDAPTTPANAVHTQAGAGLAFTGTDVVELIAIAGVALVAGALVVRVSRVRRAS
jgi:hypothetical protein